MRTQEDYELMMLGYQKKVELLDESYKKQRAMLDAKMVELDEERRKTAEDGINELIAEIERKPGSLGVKPETKKRTMSAAGRKRIAAAQKKRWAAIKAAAEVSAPAKPKRKLSKKGRAAIVAATKKRWAAVREANKAGHNGH